MAGRFRGKENLCDWGLPRALHLRQHPERAALPVAEALGGCRLQRAFQWLGSISSFVSCIQNKTIRFLGKKRIPETPGIFPKPSAARAFC